MGKIEEYNKIVFKDKSLDATNTKNQDRLKRALEIALENRRLEIELTWKRATYFSVLISAIAVAYTTAFNSENSNFYFLKIILPFLGFIFSTAWFLVNKGSKFWQENWENHSDILARQYVGHITNILLKETKKSGLFSGSPYSVSKISIVVSFITILVWGAIIISPIVEPLVTEFWAIEKNQRDFWLQIFLVDISLISLVTFIMLCKSSFTKNNPRPFSSKDLEYFDLKRFEKKD